MQNLTLLGKRCTQNHPIFYQEEQLTTAYNITLWSLLIVPSHHETNAMQTSVHRIHAAKQLMFSKGFTEVFSARACLTQCRVVCESLVLRSGSCPCKNNLLNAGRTSMPLDEPSTALWQCQEQKTDSVHGL